MGLAISRLAALRKVLFGPQEMRILMVGLDAAGKTTVLYQLRLGENVVTIPTIGFNVEKVEYKNLSFTVWDIGGQDKIRRLWKHYYNGVNGIIFVVDSNDPARFKEAGDEIARLASEPELDRIPLLVLANKQDLRSAAPTKVIAEAVGMHTLRGGRKWFVQGAAATTGDGLYEGLDWLATQVSEEVRGG